MIRAKVFEKLARKLELRLKLKSLTHKNFYLPPCKCKFNEQSEFNVKIPKPVICVWIHFWPFKSKRCKITVYSARFYGMDTFKMSQKHRQVYQT